MPPKARTPAPIDRPISRAYVRQFTGWSTDRTPGLSDPTSFRLMENVMVNRDGSVRVRPGLRYLSYAVGPTNDVAGVAIDLELVGSYEPFYLNTGEKAYLQGVKEYNGVTWRVIVPDKDGQAVFALDDPYVDFKIPQGIGALKFSAATTYVSYVQVDNKIFALSNAGEPMRMFFVGKEKQAKALFSIERPAWDRDDKLDVIHPESAWILQRDIVATRRNLLKNPSFEIGADFWDVPYAKARRPKTPPKTPISGDYVLTLETQPYRTNLCYSPLGDVATNGVPEWYPARHWTELGESIPDPVTITAAGDHMNVHLDVAEKREFYARGRICEGVEAGKKYQIALNIGTLGTDVVPLARVRFQGVNGHIIGEDVIFETDTSGRWHSKPFLAPKGAVSLRVLVGGRSTKAAATDVQFNRIVVCPSEETTDYFDGNSGADYYWLGDPNDSASTYHPTQNISITSHKTRAIPGQGLYASIYTSSTGSTRNMDMTLRIYDKADNQIIGYGTATTTGNGGLIRRSIGNDTISNQAARADLDLLIHDVPRGEKICLDAAMMEPKVTAVGTYFDGSTTDQPLLKRTWKDEEHKSVSIETEYENADTIPTEETPTEDTLIATGGPYVNVYGFGFFYTFDNEVGESAPSKITEIRCQRPWSDWVWEKPNAAGEPNGHLTKHPNLAADQLVAIMPEEVYNEAVAAGATQWSLYMVTWSEQDAAPVMAMKVESRKLGLDTTYQTHGWARVTAETTSAVDELPLPRKATLHNYSDPSRGGSGALVRDRLVIVNDPTDAAVIRWSSNKQGEYTNFTPSKGGGYKTLTSGNLNVPVAVKLWQNPQSADTIVILCLGTDGKSTAYYMSPAEISSQSESISVMGFEETTATPGTVSPFGVEVFNNSLYHPLEDQLMKSTASNYNINHTSLTDNIRNVWADLVQKDKIVSAQHDNRLYYLVNNPDGEPLEDGCRGNEIWVYDAQAKTGTWSRWLIQAHSLHRLEFGGRVYMGVTRPEGIYYLDPETGLDETVQPDLSIAEVPIPWYLESNTQGANRAHDAWCHLQQVGVILGEFAGRMRFGIKSLDLNGKPVVVEKRVRDTDPLTEKEWDIEENLLVRRDLREWYFYAGSALDDTGAVLPSYGQISLVQFRYTPSTVNTGYEFGSVETFEYGRDAAEAISSTTVNGVPLPLLDSRRP